MNENRIETYQKENNIYQKKPENKKSTREKLEKLVPCIDCGRKVCFENGRHLCWECRSGKVPGLPKWVLNRRK